MQRPPGPDKAWLHRALIIVGPLGLAIDIFLSLWVAQLHVDRSAVIQTEPRWRPGEQLAVRAQLIDRDRHGIDDAGVELTLHDAAGGEFPLGELSGVAGNGVHQGRITVPEAARGPARLAFVFREHQRDPLIEHLTIEISDTRQDIPPKPTVSSSTLQWADDTDAQTKPDRIELRPFGRTLAGFSNRFFVRVSDGEGKPRQVDYRVRLISGEFAKHLGSETDPPTIAEGTTNRLGLADFEGQLDSEVVRFRVELGPDGSPAPPDTEATGNAPKKSSDPKDETDEPSRHRRFRFVSFPGAVRVHSERLAVRPGDLIPVGVSSFRKGRHIHVDIHGADGAWCDTAIPRRSEKGRVIWDWTIPSDMKPGLAQLEAYPYTNAPGESSAVARIQVLTARLDAAKSLIPLVKRQRDRIEIPRVDKHFDRDHERKYLDAVAAAELSPEEVALGRAWLIGTLPVELYGPPLALTTREREDEAVAARKRRWAIGLRWFLLGGGGLFIVLVGASLSRAHSEMSRAIDEQLEEAGWDDDTIAGFHHGKRTMAVRGLLLIMILVASLVLSTILLENLVWVA